MLQVFYTAHWDPISVRRGDALGLRNITDEFAEKLTPKMNNATQDGRWLTILSWCLVRSQGLYDSPRAVAKDERELQQLRYAWLRPLELMWVARTLILSGADAKGRTLAGQRAVKRWLENENINRFGMSPDQYNAYRQLGMYGGYRIAFRRWHGMTQNGDGWTPSVSAYTLARWLDAKLGKARPPWKLDEAKRSKYSSSNLDDSHARWWLKNWKHFRNDGAKAQLYTLPRKRPVSNSRIEKLAEHELLSPIVFGLDEDGKTRRHFAKLALNSKGQTHQAICDYIGETGGAEGGIQLLPHFTRMADAGIAAMEFVNNALNGNPKISLAKLAEFPGAGIVADQLHDATHRWLQNSKPTFRHQDAADRFARAFGLPTTKAIFESLILYHEQFGGGLRWFALRDGTIEPRSGKNTRVSRYRFRLWSLCRLATQCGIIKAIPTGLFESENISDENEDDNE